MKIFEVTYDYLPNCFWGTGVHVGYLSKSLAAYGHSVTVITRNNVYANVDTGYVPGEPRVIRCTPELDFEALVNESYPTDSFKSIDGVLKFCDAVAKYVIQNCEPPGVIHNHTWFTYPVARQLSEQWNIPIISTVHILSSQYVNSGLKDTQAPGWHAMTALEEVWLGRSEKIIVPTTMLKTQIQSDYPSLKGKVEVVEHPSPPGPIKEDYSFSSPFRILTVGRLLPEKGFVALIEALKMINSQQFQWVAIGEGLLLDSYKLCTQRYGINAQWLGKLPPKEVRMQYCETDLTVAPSLTETYGLVVREAMQAGAPIIASKIAAFEAQIHDGKSGILIPLVESKHGLIMDPEKLADAILTLAESQTKREDLGRKAYLGSRQRNDIDTYIKQLVQMTNVVGR